MTTPASNLTDEQLATALQQQYRMDFLRRQEERSRRKGAASASQAIEVTYNGNSDEAYARQIQLQMDRESSTQHIKLSHPTTTASFGNTGDDDAAFAQQLQDEELARQYSSRYSRESAMTSHRDIEQQQLTDAEIAQSLARLEQEDALRRDREQRSQQRSQSQWCRRIIPLFALALAITIPLLFVFGVFSKDDIPFFGDFGNDWVDSDPWSEVGSVAIDESGNANISVGPDAVRWRSNGRGLQLQILNAMEDKYEQFLTTAVQNWDAGAPIDSLTLNVRKGSYDFECKEEDGLLKICSGDYGATKWRGLNEVKLNSVTRIIVSSTAKINNYYLNSESDAQKLYTICHELGHGFGLPHWDTDFYNTDLGNCMDYTIRPQNNMKPNESNFNYLADLYGGESVSSSAADVPETETANPVDNKGKGGKGKGRRILHRSPSEEVHYIEIPDENIIILRQYRLN